MLRSFAFVTLLLLTASPAAAQDPTPEPDVVVVGERTEDAVRAFVGAMSAAPRGVDQLARWDRRICAGVAGLRGRYAQFLIDRMAQRAFEVDLDVGEPGCRPNVLIVVSPDPDAIARELYDDHPGALGYISDTGEATRGRRLLRETFLNSDAPVRWWHVSHRGSAGGGEIDRHSPTPCTGGSSALDISACYGTNPLGGGSRLRSATTQDFGAAFVIVDANRLSEIDYNFNALADYLAMVTLAQLDPDVDVSSFPSVLNLFTLNNTPNGMTDWDLDYLRGLYSSNRDAASVSRHEADIARGMVRERESQSQ